MENSPPTTPFQPSFPGYVPEPAAPEPQRLVLQWGSGGEARIPDDDQRAMRDMVDGCRPGEYRSLFPVHGAWGALSLGIDNITVWLFASGGGPCIVGELVDPSRARPQGVPASGIVDIARLDPEVQAALMTILKRAK